MTCLFMDLILYRATHTTLRTRGLLRSWGVALRNYCPFCSLEEENLPHLFLRCGTTRPVIDAICTLIKNALNINFNKNMGNIYFKKLIHRINSVNDKQLVLFYLVSYLYEVWLHRNVAVFRYRNPPASVILASWLKRVTTRRNFDFKLLGQSAGNIVYQHWPIYFFDNIIL